MGVPRGSDEDKMLMNSINESQSKLYSFDCVHNNCFAVADKPYERKI